MRQTISPVEVVAVRPKNSTTASLIDASSGTPPLRSRHGKDGIGSVEGSRIGEQGREFDPDAPVRVGRETGGIGQLAEPRAVRAYGEDLVAEGIRAERIARSVED